VNGSLSYTPLPITLPYNIAQDTYWSDFFGAQAG